jgi:hypothetical protein
MHFEHDVAVGTKSRDSIARLSAFALEESCQPVRPLAKLGIRKAALAIHDGRAIGETFRGAVKKMRRIQRSRSVQKHSQLQLKW